MRNGPQGPSCSQRSCSSPWWQGSERLQAAPRCPRAQGLLWHAVCRHNGAWEELAFQKRSSEAPKPRCFLEGDQLWADQVPHGRFFSLESLFPICFHRCPRGRGALFREAGRGRWGLGAGSSTGKPVSRKMTHDCRNARTNPSALFIPPRLLVWGLDQSVGRRPAAPAARPAGDSLRSPNLRSRPGLLDQNLHFNETGDSSAHYSLRSPEVETHEFLLSDRWHSVLPFF